MNDCADFAVSSWVDEFGEWKWQCDVCERLVGGFSSHGSVAAARAHHIATEHTPSPCLSVMKRQAKEQQ